MKNLLVQIVGLVSATLCFGAGEIALDFGANINGPASALVATPDGGFLAAISGEVVKYDANGVLDPSFDSELTPTSGGTSFLLKTDSNGNFFVVDWVVIEGTRYDLAKVAANGRVVRSFEPVSISYRAHGGSSSITALCRDGSGGCYVGGTFIELNDIPAQGLAHIDEHGNITAIDRPESVANSNPTDLALIGERLLVVQESAAYFIDQADTVEPITPPISGVQIRYGSATYDSSYGLALSCSFIRNGHAEERIYVLDSDGLVNSSFQSGLNFGATPLRQLGWDSHGRLFGTNAKVSDEGAANTDDGRIWGPKRVLPDGSLDPTWSRTIDFETAQSAWCQLTNHDYVVSGRFSSVSGHSASYVLKLKGTEDESVQAIQQSARGLVGRNGSKLVMGLVIPPSSWSRDVLIRAISGSLQTFGVTQVLAGTRFTLYQGEEPILQMNPPNSNTVTSFVGSKVGAFPMMPGMREAQKVVSLGSGAYTIIFDSIESFEGEGELLGEVYFR